MDTIILLVFGLLCVAFGVSMINNPSAPDKFWYPEDNPEYSQIGRRVVQAMGVLAVLFGTVVMYLGSGL